MVTSHRADRKRDSPYRDWQLEAGLHPRDFLPSLFRPVCVPLRSGRGEQISAILTSVSSYFKAATKAEALCMSNLVTFQCATRFT